MVGTIVLGLILSMSRAPVRDAAPGDESQAPAPRSQPPRAVESAPGVIGEDEPGSFVPLHPRTAGDRQTLDAIREYVAARALEDHHDWREAVEQYQKALKSLPDDTAILRRLSRLCYVLNRTDEAIRYARQVLDAEPGDTSMISLLLEHYLRKDDAKGAEALLLKLLENPKLEPDSAGQLLVERSLGDLYAMHLKQPEKAADVFAKLVDALDKKAANALSPADLKRILGSDEADAYVRFGTVFYDAKRYDLAVKAFRRGLVYEPDHPDLARYLAQTLLRAGRADEALTALEPTCAGNQRDAKRTTCSSRSSRPSTAKRTSCPGSKRPRNDPKNAPLQYLLAERYREAGQREKADALYQHLLATQPDPQGFGALSASLLKEKKADELIKILGDAFGKPDTLEAVKPQIEAIINQPEFAEQMLEAGLKLQEADPPKLSRESRLVLSYIATKAKKLDKFLSIQRLALKHDPSPQAYREFWLDLYRNSRYEEAAATLDEMIAKYPAERTPQILVARAQSHAMAGQFDPALASLEEALKLNPNDPDVLRDALRLKGYVLGKMEKNDAAIAHYKSMLERYPNNDEIFKLAHSGLSIIYVNMGQFDKGEAELELLLRRDPEDPGINNDLGYLYADQGKRLEEAEAMIRKAIAAEPENMAYLDSLGWVLYRRGKAAEAVAPLEQAAKDSTADATIHDHLGDVYFKLGQVDKAREAWRTAERIAANAKPPDKRVIEIRKKLESLSQLDRALTEPADARPNP